MILSGVYFRRKNCSRKITMSTRSNRKGYLQKIRKCTVKNEGFKIIEKMSNISEEIDNSMANLENLQVNDYSFINSLH